MLRSGRMQFMGPAGPRRRHALLQRIVFGIDAALRRWNSVVEFTTDPTCILRIRVDRLERALVLADGTSARAGERFVDLHLWNEHIPAMPKEGASIAWDTADARLLPAIVAAARALSRRATRSRRHRRGALHVD